MKKKTVITYGIAVLLVLGFVYLFHQAFNELTPPVTTTESFSEALWSTWSVSIIIVSFVLLAGGASILVLIGGSWRWE